MARLRILWVVLICLISGKSKSSPSLCPLLLQMVLSKTSQIDSELINSLVSNPWRTRDFSFFRQVLSSRGLGVVFRINVPPEITKEGLDKTIRKAEFYFWGGFWEGKSPEEIESILFKEIEDELRYWPNSDETTVNHFVSKQIASLLENPPLTGPADGQLDRQKAFVLAKERYRNFESEYFLKLRKKVVAEKLKRILIAIANFRKIKIETEPENLFYNKLIGFFEKEYREIEGSPDGPEAWGGSRIHSLPELEAVSIEMHFDSTEKVVEALLRNSFDFANVQNPAFPKSNARFNEFFGDFDSLRQAELLRLYLRVLKPGEKLGFYEHQFFGEQYVMDVKILDVEHQVVSEFIRTFGTLDQGQANKVRRIFESNRAHTVRKIEFTREEIFNLLNPLN